MTQPFLFVNFGGVQQGAANIAAAVTQLVGHVQDLTANSTLESWASAHGVKDAYLASRGQLLQGAAELTQLLQGLGINLNDVHDIYQVGERIAAGLWGNR